MGGVCFSHPEMGGGGHTQLLGSFNTENISFCYAEGGDAKCFRPFKGGGRGTSRFTLSQGGGIQNVSDLRFSHFVAPPPSPLLMTSS